MPALPRCIGKASGKNKASATQPPADEAMDGGLSAHCAVQGEQALLSESRCSPLL